MDKNIKDRLNEFFNENKMRTKQVRNGVGASGPTSIKGSQNEEGKKSQSLKKFTNIK